MFTLLYLTCFSFLATLTQANWNYSTGADFKPCSGKLSNKPSASVSDAVYNRLVVNKGYIDRLNTLAAQNNSDLWKFNFNPHIAPASSHASYGAGGIAVLATRGTAPSLIDTGVAMALGFLEPCGISSSFVVCIKHGAKLNGRVGMNTPHYHPFATQLSTVRTLSGFKPFPRVHTPANPLVGRIRRPAQSRRDMVHLRRPRTNVKHSLHLGDGHSPSGLDPLGIQRQLQSRGYGQCLRYRRPWHLECRQCFLQLEPRCGECYARVSEGVERVPGW